MVGLDVGFGEIVGFGEKVGEEGAGEVGADVITHGLSAKHFSDPGHSSSVPFGQATAHFDAISSKVFPHHLSVSCKAPSDTSEIAVLATSVHPIKVRPTS